MRRHTIHLVQSSTVERVRSGICLMAYWLHKALLDAGRDVRLHEDVTMHQWQDLLARFKPGLDTVLLDLSSYPQVDAVLLAYTEARGCGLEVGVFGLQPMIEAFGLPFVAPEDLGVDLLQGCFTYPIRYSEYRNAQPEMDSHVRCEDSRPFMPLFLSVGCKRRCPYCYVSTSNYPFGVADLDTIEMMLRHFAARDWNVHFMDENLFLHPHVERILDLTEELGLRYICLSDSLALSKRVKDGTSRLVDSGYWLAEVGLETASRSALAKEQSLGPILQSGLPVFWLTMTFLPGDTIDGMMATGEFLREHGWARDQMVHRIATNSTRGGLGQFFHTYHGTEYHERAKDMGVAFNDRPTRLFPSFIGHGLLNSRPYTLRSLDDEDVRWFDLYGVTGRARSLYVQAYGQHTWADLMRGDLRNAIALAQMARLGIIADSGPSL